MKLSEDKKGKGEKPETICMESVSSLQDRIRELEEEKAELQNLLQKREEQYKNSLDGAKIEIANLKALVELQKTKMKKPSSSGQQAEKPKAEKLPSNDLRGLLKKRGKANEAFKALSDEPEENLILEEDNEELKMELDAVKEENLKWNKYLNELALLLGTKASRSVIKASIVSLLENGQMIAKISASLKCSDNLDDVISSIEQLQNDLDEKNQENSKVFAQLTSFEKVCEKYLESKSKSTAADLDSFIASSLDSKRCKHDSIEAFLVAEDMASEELIDVFNQMRDFIMNKKDKLIPQENKVLDELLSFFKVTEVSDIILKVNELVESENDLASILDMLIDVLNVKEYSEILDAVKLLEAGNQRLVAFQEYSKTIADIKEFLNLQEISMIMPALKEYEKNKQELLHLRAVVNSLSADFKILTEIKEYLAVSDSSLIMEKLVALQGDAKSNEEIIITLRDMFDLSDNQQILQQLAEILEENIELKNVLNLLEEKKRKTTELVITNQVDKEKSMKYEENEARIIELILLLVEASLLDSDEISQIQSELDHLLEGMGEDQKKWEDEASNILNEVGVLLHLENPTLADIQKSISDLQSQLNQVYLSLKSLLLVRNPSASCSDSEFVEFELKYILRQLQFLSVISKSHGMDDLEMIFKKLAEKSFEYNQVICNLVTEIPYCFDLIESLESNFMMNVNHVKDEIRHMSSSSAVTKEVQLENSCMFQLLSFSDDINATLSEMLHIQTAENQNLSQEIFRACQDHNLNHSTSLLGLKNFILFVNKNELEAVENRNTVFYLRKMLEEAQIEGSDLIKTVFDAIASESLAQMKNMEYLDQINNSNRELDLMKSDMERLHSLCDYCGIDSRNLSQVQSEAQIKLYWSLKTGLSKLLGTQEDSSLEKLVGCIGSALKQTNSLSLFEYFYQQTMLIGTLGLQSIESGIRSDHSSISLLLDRKFHDLEIACYERLSELERGIAAFEICIHEHQVKECKKSEKKFSIVEPLLNLTFPGIEVFRAKKIEFLMERVENLQSLFRKWGIYESCMLKGFETVGMAIDNLIKIANVYCIYDLSAFMVGKECSLSLYDFEKNIHLDETKILGLQCTELRRIEAAISAVDQSFEKNDVSVYFSNLLEEVYSVYEMSLCISGDTSSMERRADLSKRLALSVANLSIFVQNHKASFSTGDKKLGNYQEILEEQDAYIAELESSILKLKSEMKISDSEPTDRLIEERDFLKNCWEKDAMKLSEAEAELNSLRNENQRLFERVIDLLKAPFDPATNLPVAKVISDSQVQEEYQAALTEIKCEYQNSLLKYDENLHKIKEKLILHERESKYKEWNMIPTMTQTILQ